LPDVADGGGQIGELLLAREDRALRQVQQAVFVLAQRGAELVVVPREG
jgi:hypothetical protein